MQEAWPWLTLALLGAYHGLNPAMGWLFAVALGLQERSRGAVLRALAPIGLGHAAAIALTVAVAGLAQAVVRPDYLRWGCAGTLLGFGIYKLLKRGHPRWVGMRVGFGDLTAWSLLMSSAHGAGLMLLPILLHLPGRGQAHAAHAGHGEQLALSGQAAVTLSSGLAAVGVHTAAMFLAMGLAAVAVYETMGLAILRRAWLNLDLIWAGALVAAGIITLLL